MAVVHTHSRALKRHPQAKAIRGTLLDALTACSLPVPVVLPERWGVDDRRLDHGDPAVLDPGRCLCRGVIQERGGPGAIACDTTHAARVGAASFPHKQ